MKLIVAGSRTFQDYTLLSSVLGTHRHHITELLHGGARGRIGKLNGIFAPVAMGAHFRNPTVRTPHRLCVLLPAPVGQLAGEVRGASPGCSGGEGFGTAGGSWQGRDDSTRKCTGAAHTSPMGRHHGAAASSKAAISW
jgi:hypothetical protein